MRILLVEDEKALSKVLVKIFEKNNYSCDFVYNGKDALDYLEDNNYDAVVMDVMMPVMDGITALKKLRERKNNVPVLLLTAKSEISDKVLGLDSGANYYLTKPFDTKELLATIRAITRTKDNVSSKIVVGNTYLDRATFELSTENGTFKLANREYQMMEIFMSNPHNIFSSEHFMEKVWGYDSDADISVVWVYISYLRKKLTSLKSNLVIKSSRNAGYYLEEDK